MTRERFRGQSVVENRASGPFPRWAMIDSPHDAEIAIRARATRKDPICETVPLTSSLSITSFIVGEAISNEVIEWDI